MQSHENWTYLICDNASTDSTPDISHKYSKLDSRICLIRFEDFVDQRDSFNRAFAAVDRYSKWCMPLMGDDWLYPNCLEQMIAAEMRHLASASSADITGGDSVFWTQVPYDRRILPGRGVIARMLYSGENVIGGPTAQMFRSDVIVGQAPFFDRDLEHADTDAAFRDNVHNDVAVDRYVRLVTALLERRLAELLPASRGRRPRRQHRRVGVDRFDHCEGGGPAHARHAGVHVPRLCGRDQGWYKDVLAQQTRADLFKWGVWLGNRFKDAKNLLWLGLGDYAPPDGSEGALRARAIADGIKSTGAPQLFMAEASSPDSIPGAVPDFGAIVDQNSFYGYGPAGAGRLRDRRPGMEARAPKPAWMQEGTYEYENNMGHFSAEPWDTRRGRFWSVLGGGTAGDGFGSKDVWQWKDIPRSLSSPGAEFSTEAFGLFASLPWWELKPSGSGDGRAGIDLVRSGQGAWGGPRYIASALTSDRHWMLAYVPVMKQGSRTFSVAMSALSGPVRARWFDPATGNYIAISDGYRYGASGVRSFTTQATVAMAPTTGCSSWTRRELLDAASSRPMGSTSLRRRVRVV